ncbi:hypothetical protein [Agrococcus sp. Marseille-P2731]|uniref:hypothetical protein n=1 Tax=Agrococcus sp. Marseille-P2731 TaxID=1841862 RepID=UPI0009303A05|nr:hypothetical protein [Agrococcus sp. Marseille-P2731]
MTDGATAPDPTGSGAVAHKAWSTVTWASVLFSALGLLFAFASGLGLPAAIAGIACGAVALRRDRQARPWPLIATIIGAVATVIAVVHLIIAANIWLPQLLAA